MAHELGHAEDLNRGKGVRFNEQKPLQVVTKKILSYAIHKGYIVPVNNRKISYASLSIFEIDTKTIYIQIMNIFLKMN